MPSMLKSSRILESIVRIHTRIHGASAHPTYPPNNYITLLGEL